jgi:geranylgeranyl diphosphate synthase type I
VTPAAGSTSDATSVADLRERIEAALAAFLTTREKALAELGDDVAPLLGAAYEAVTGGKRLRATFCYWGWRAAGGADDERAVTAAASLELLHASALVHDDVMDGSDVRRGRPASHRRFSALHNDREWTGSSERFGNAAAILLGDLLLTWSDEMLRASGFAVDTVARALPYFDAMRTEVIAGQFLDLEAQASGEDSMARAMRVLRFKAAKYTVERPLHVGAALAGASESLISALSGYGVPLGEAFQVRDDLLGVFGDPKVTGKPAGDDVREGKRTVLSAMALGAADPSDRSLLAISLGNANLDLAGVEAARAAMRRSGALSGGERLIEDLAATALDALKRAPIRDETARTALRGLVQSATQRTT